MDHIWGELSSLKIKTSLTAFSWEVIVKERCPTWPGSKKRGQDWVQNTERELNDDGIWMSEGEACGTWQWGQAWCSSGRTLHSSGWGRLRAGRALSLRAFSSAVSRARKQYSHAIEKKKLINKTPANRILTYMLCISISPPKHFHIL